MNLTPAYPPSGQHPPPPFPPGLGPCGLTVQEWHGFLTFVLLLLFLFLIALVVAWFRSEDVSEMWLRAKYQVEETRTAWRKELLEPVLLPQHVEPTPPPGPGLVASLVAQTRSTVTFFLAPLFPSLRHRPGA